MHYALTFRKLGLTFIHFVVCFYFVSWWPAAFKVNGVLFSGREAGSLCVSVFVQHYLGHRRMSSGPEQGKVRKLETHFFQVGRIFCSSAHLIFQKQKNEKNFLLLLSEQPGRVGSRIFSREGGSADFKKKNSKIWSTFFKIDQIDFLSSF